ncbi:MAG: hypothetical protein KBC66_08265 [Kiritimatiellae bacterium]|nr:hypothetical protein [Kiritimatiellia bacterium]NLD90946.1 hypothetical protein [Lentisphaerota bacterium]HPC19194.1 hypothetical protein [Kiritimatiellia bacterium]
MDAIKSLFSPAGGSARRNPRAYIVDAARLVDEKTGRRLAPRDQVQILNALARVAKQENLDLQVVFESDRPLREVDHGGEYNGLKVFYAPDNEQLVAMALKLSRSADGALVSSGVTMESRATEAGIPVLCSSTFRKAFLQGGLPGGGERRDRSNGNGDRDRRRGRDRRRDRNDRGGSGEGNRAPREESQGSGPSESPSASSGTGEAPASPEDNSTVRNLIDLVE